MKYTNKERRAIADIFKTVRKKMKRNQPWGDQHYSRYICDNIADLYCNEIDKSLAGQVVKERINYEFSVEYWLVQEGCISKGFAEEARYGDRHSFVVKQMHAYRLRWLKSLAAEFSAKNI